MINEKKDLSPDMQRLISEVMEITEALPDGYGVEYLRVAAIIQQTRKFELFAGLLSRLNDKQIKALTDIAATIEES